MNDEDITNDKDVTKKGIRPVSDNHPYIKMTDDSLCPHCNRKLFEHGLCYGCVHCGRVYDKITMKEVARV